MERVWVALGGVFGATAVAMAALAAHARLPTAALEAVRSGVEMQGWHALALLFLGVWGGGVCGRLAGIAWAIGVLLFCGSLYGLAFAELRASLAPAGGVLLIAGWLLVGMSAWRRQ